MQRPVGRPARRGFGGLSVWQWQLPPSARWGARSVYPPAQRAAAQMGANKAAKQVAAPKAVMWVVVSVTGTRAATCVEAARRSRTLGVRELVTPRALAVTALLMNH